jgi:DNA-binding winged helix-turn-helix (wHTH) protein
VIVKLCFGDVEFAADSRQIRRSGRDVHVSTKAFELLKLLVERRPDAVSKDDIRRHLWPDTHVSETNLPTLIAEIREAIGDDARRPRFVRTLHRFGYAFRGDAAEAPPRTGPAVDQRAAWLIGSAKRIALSAGENVLGREGTAVVLLESPTVSRRHARLTIADRGMTIEDLGSKNGTWVNDRRVTSPVPIADGDSIRTGSLAFTFRIAGPATSTQTV